MGDEKEEGSSDKNQGWSSPHEALFFVLANLPLFELMAMSRVCKSLRDAVSNDILPWLNIIADGPLSLRLNDEILKIVASKAKARMRSLALINCVKITDYGLLDILAQNSNIIKLHLPGCTKLTPAGVIAAVKLLTKHNHSLKSLQINGIDGFQKEDLETLYELINPDQTQHIKTKIFYHQYKKFSTMRQHEETTKPIDVDLCPKCDQVRMVFDCPEFLCGKKRKQETRECRGCIFCIPRCVECGACIISTEEVEEASCADTLCSECWLQLPKCSFCNKPYCTQHANQWHKQSSALVCASCHSKYI